MKIGIRNFIYNLYIGTYFSIDYLKIRIKSQHSFLSTCIFIKYVNLSAYRPLYTICTKTNREFLRENKRFQVFLIGHRSKICGGMAKGKELV